MKKYKRNIDDSFFWIEFYKNNNIQFKNLIIEEIKGSKFTDSIFNSKNNQDIISLRYDIVDRDGKTISHIETKILKRSFDCSISNTKSLIKILKYEKSKIEISNLFERTLMSVYTSEREIGSFNNNLGDKILLIRTKYLSNADVVMYKEEFTDLYTFIFEDKYDERVSI
ncbi:hypothetical protein ABGF49_06040 [Helcococcus ovis]|uniref:hypothetical protein n=1 Tax=Helcococcus TaxID=31983 RepID=UPI00106F56CA|nr:hypothetical protein [Helcococcus ovis]TFF67415.1 hypothetical protein EQF93_05255 [Helcococcus ovis]WNZ01537.1 hypothetical protein EQF90_001435 [Helcococcus ovis]